MIKFGTNLYKFPTFGADLPGLIEFVRTAEELGYIQMRLLDHVVGIVAERHGGLDETPYTASSYIHECFTLMAYLSAMTTRIRFMPGVLVLPQRQTVLVAKQAAEIDVLSGGRLTLGISVGYNRVEFEAMGASFPGRGKRFEEQIEVLRRLWTQEVVNYKGAYHCITDACLAPLPIQRPIPLWFGMGRVIQPIPPDAVLRRAGHLADGWLPQFKPGPEARAAIRKVHDAARETGRDPGSIPLEMNLWVEDKKKAQLIDEVKQCIEIGAVQINVRFEESSAREQTEALKRFREIMDVFDSGA